MKKIRILSVICLVAVLMSLFFVQVFAFDAPFFQDDVELATGGKADGLEGTSFAWPFAGGENLLMVADKNDAASQTFVIEGNKSIYFNNTGETATADMTPMITKAGPGNVLVFDPAQIYIARFLMKVATPFVQGGKLTITVRTWDWGDKWVNFVLNPTEDGNIKGKVEENGRVYDKVAIQKVSDDTYEVALRFQGVENKTSCYLFWYLEKEAALSFDGFKYYKSNEDPSKAFELTAVASSNATDSTDTSDASTTSDTSTTAASEQASQEITSNASNQTDNTASKDEAANASLQESTAESSDVSDKTEGRGLSVDVIAAIAIVVIVLLGAVTGFLIVKKAKNRNA